MNRVGCDPYVSTSKTATLKWNSTGHVIEEVGASSNTTKRCARKPSKVIGKTEAPKIGFLKDQVGPRALISKARFLEKIWIYDFRIKSVYMEYESSPNFVLIEH